MSDPKKPSLAEKKSPLKRDVRKLARYVWQYSQKNSKDTVFDADLKDVIRWVYGFLAKDVFGKKIVLLDDEKLRTAGVVARVLKRKRQVSKTRHHQETIEKIKTSKPLKKTAGFLGTYYFSG